MLVLILALMMHKTLFVSKTLSDRYAMICTPESGSISIGRTDKGRADLCGFSLLTFSKNFVVYPA